MFNVYFKFKEDWRFRHYHRTTGKESCLAGADGFPRGIRRCPFRPVEPNSAAAAAILGSFRTVSSGSRAHLHRPVRADDGNPHARPRAVYTRFTYTAGTTMRRRANVYVFFFPHIRTPLFPAIVVCAIKTRMNISCITPVEILFSRRRRRHELFPVSPPRDCLARRRTASRRNGWALNKPRSVTIGRHRHIHSACPETWFGRPRSKDVYHPGLQNKRCSSIR